MKWYYKILGGHTHVRVFMNGGKCGDLCFRNEEFNSLLGYIVTHPACPISTINETPAEDAAPNSTPQNPIK